MSLKTKVEIVAHIGSFRSIAMYCQGSYYCEIKFYIETPNAKYFAKPVKREKSNRKNFNIRESRFINNDMIDRSRRNSIKYTKRVYNTQGFNVEYNLDECNLNEYAYFTHEIDLPKVYTNEEMMSIKIPLMMKVTLYMKAAKKGEQPPSDHFEKATVTKHRIGNIINGIYKAVPILFNSPFMSVLNTSVHWSAQNIVLYGRSKMELVRKS